MGVVAVSLSCYNNLATITHLYFNKEKLIVILVDAAEHPWCITSKLWHMVAQLYHSLTHDDTGPV